MRVSMVVIVLLTVLGLGFLIGSACERASLHRADDGSALIYSGETYVRVMAEKPTLEDYLSAAGNPKK